MLIDAPLADGAALAPSLWTLWAGWCYESQHDDGLTSFGSRKARAAPHPPCHRLCTWGRRSDV